ncbi:MAG: hypothetical protein HF978_00155 [Desulfobacteraceae bacterium]|nr:hypothetical protein [Desulfobacteraceae bacterium]MBC2753947.1 hypothetical protein [Desulfobacteraceae bacterium]
MAYPKRNPRLALVCATLAAAVATLGDFLMLYAVNAGRVELGLPAPGAAILPCGYFLGVIAIPLYGVGFWAVAQMLASKAPRAGRVVLISGVIMAVLGSVIHGVTGLSIEAQMRAGGAMPDPVTAIFDYGVYLIPLWAAASIFSCSGSVAFIWGVAKGNSILPRFVAVFNPVILTACIGLAGATTPMLRAFLIPASPNVAHIIFFGLLTVISFAGRPTGGKKKRRDLS